MMSQMAHGGAVRFFDDEVALPESDSAMGFEGGHAAEHAAVFEMGKAPFPGLFDLRASLVYEFAKVFQDRAGEVGRAPDVGVNGCDAFSHRLRIWKSMAAGQGTIVIWEGRGSDTNCTDCTDL